MEVQNNTFITVQNTVEAPVEKVWQYWSLPEHITKWCAASSDWHAPAAENDLKKGGKFKTVMAARDGSMSFDFEGVYTRVEPFKVIEYAMSDGRKVKIVFNGQGNSTEVTESFEPESTNSRELQKSGWQAILDNFKKYTEEH